MNESFNYEMVQLARESRGWTQTKLANAAGLTQGFVSRLEAGEKEISPDRLEAIAHTLHYPVSFFYQRGTYAGFGLSLVFFRKRAGTKLGDLRRLQAEKNIRRMQMTKLLSGVDVLARQQFPPMDIDDHDGNVEKIAALVRASWNLRFGPIKNLVTAIENAGGIVFRFDFGTRDIDALSEWPENCPPLFYLNSKAPTDRARFSLAHELGHIIMHRSASETMESEADRFASEFLMPAKEIKAQLAGLTLRRAAQLKPYWRTSMAALVRRAKDLGQISKDDYSRVYGRITLEVQRMTG